MRDASKGVGSGASQADVAREALLRVGIPALPGVHVPRSRLSSVLSRSEGVPLVLLSAPAGTGKTVAVTDWIRTLEDGPTAWVAFERGETGFWPRVLESLEGVGIDPSAVGPATSDTCLGSGRIIVLANLVVELRGRLTLVLDGYELASRELADELDFLLRHCGDGLRLVVIGRVDPVLPLYRYRLTDSILEIRAPDLAFSDEEAGRLLRATGVELSGAAVRSLNRRVRGWPVGLRFAARTLVHQPSPEEYVATVVEQTGEINEYLVAEVLDAQPPEVRRILLASSVPDTFRAELLALLVGQEAVKAMPELSASTAFVEPVPDQPGTFAFYPFFRDLLRAQLAYESPELAVELHRVTARWEAGRGAHLKALQHLATIGDWEEIASYLVRNALVAQLLLDAPDGVLRGLAGKVPHDLRTAEAGVVRAATALGRDDGDRCSAELSEARALAPTPGAAPIVSLAIIVVDALRGALEDPAARAAELACAAERALSEVGPRCPGPRLLELTTVVDFAAGAAALRQGSLERAALALSGVAAHQGEGTSMRLRMQTLGYLAVVEAVRGNLSDAVRHAEQALTAASEARRLSFDTPPAAHVALACVAVDRDEREVAHLHLAACASSRWLPRDPVCRSLVRAAQAALDGASGDPGSTLDLLELEAEATAVHDPWSARRLRVVAARIGLAAEEHERALAVLEVAPDQDDPEQLEIAVTAAAVHAEQGVARRDGITRALAGDQEVPLDTRVRALLAEAALLVQQGAPVRARAALERSLDLAAPEQLRRPFRDAGPSVQQLMTGDTRLIAEHSWLQARTHDLDADRLPLGSSDAHALPMVVEQLTAKETEVLGHLAELLSTDEIAEKMFVSVNTVRTHVRSILRKLGVNRRNAAIRRARELGILTT